MTSEQLHILQHALGCDQYGRNDRPNVRIPNPPYYRNHFCAGGKDEDVCRELVALGYMKQHETTKRLPYFNCSVTEEGITEESVIVGANCNGGVHQEETAMRYFFDGCDSEGHESAVDAYACLWDSLLPKTGQRWQDNPLVIVIEFGKATE